MTRGTLYVVSTPIGNLKDITHRAVEILSQVDMIVAEDTRQTAKLLSHYQIRTPRVSYHDFSSPKKLASILSRLEEGKSIALVCDSGTPLLSDPGFPLVRESVKKGIPLVPIPGPSAMLAALVSSGASMDRFVFEGFLPPKGSSRKVRLESIRSEERTQVLYESPYHLLKTLEDLKAVLGGDRKIIIARELTKIYEEFLRGTLDEIMAHPAVQKPRGEFVILIPKREKAELTPSEESTSEY